MIPNIPTGFKVVPHPLLRPIKVRVQVRFPKSKKKRIRRKWWKNPKNFTVRVDDNIIQIEDVLYVSNENYKRLKDKDYGKKSN